MGASLNPHRVEVKEILRRYNVKPKKSLGQNFLVDPLAFSQIIEAAGVLDEQVVLEIGAGTGGLTRRLAEMAKRVVALELDDRLIPLLTDVLAAYNNVELVQGDIMEQSISDLVGDDEYVVVANIPYYITSVLIRQLLDASQPPAAMVLTVQREVAERICAIDKKMSMLALSVQVFGAPRIMGYIPAAAFYPSPEVDSAIIRVDLFEAPLIIQDSLELFFDVARIGFRHKRKMLLNALAQSTPYSKDRIREVFVKASIDPQHRAESLQLSEWGSLVEVWKSIL